MEELHIDAGHELLDRLEVELGLPNSRGGEKRDQDEEKKRKEKVL